MNSSLGKLPSLGGGSPSIVGRNALAPIPTRKSLVGAPLNPAQAQSGRNLCSQLSSSYGSPAYLEERPSMLRGGHLVPLAPNTGLASSRQGHMAVIQGPPLMGLSSGPYMYDESDDEEAEIVVLEGPIRPQSMLRPLSMEGSSPATSPRYVTGLRGLREIKNSSTDFQSASDLSCAAPMRPLPLESGMKTEDGKKKKKNKKKNKKNNKSKKVTPEENQQLVGQLQPLTPMQSTKSLAALTTLSPLKVSPAMQADIEFFKTIGNGKNSDPPGTPQPPTPASLNGRQSLTPVSALPLQQSSGSPSTGLQVSSVDRQMLSSPREPLSPNRSISSVNSTGQTRSLTQRQTVPTEDMEIFTRTPQKLAPVKPAAFMQAPLKPIGATHSDEQGNGSLTSPRRGTLAPISHTRNPSLQGAKDILEPISQQTQGSTVSRTSPSYGDENVRAVGEKKNISDKPSAKDGRQHVDATAQMTSYDKSCQEKYPDTNLTQPTQPPTRMQNQTPFSIGRRRQTSDFYNSTPEDTDEEEAIQDIMYTLAGASPVNTQVAIVKRCKPTTSGSSVKAEFVRVIDEGAQEHRPFIESPNTDRLTMSGCSGRQGHLAASSDESSKSFVFESPSTHHSYHTSDEDSDVYDSIRYERSEQEEERENETYLDKLTRKKLLQTQPNNGSDVPKKNEKLEKQELYDAMIAAIAKEIDEADSKKMQQKDAVHPFQQKQVENDEPYASEISEESLTEDTISKETTQAMSSDSEFAEKFNQAKSEVKQAFTSKPKTEASHMETLKSAFAGKELPNMRQNQQAKIANENTNKTSNGSQCDLSQVLPVENTNQTSRCKKGYTKQQRGTPSSLPPSNNAIKIASKERADEKLNPSSIDSQHVSTTMIRDFPLSCSTTQQTVMGTNQKATSSVLQQSSVTAQNPMDIKVTLTSNGSHCAAATASTATSLTNSPNTKQTISSTHSTATSSVLQQSPSTTRSPTNSKANSTSDGPKRVPTTSSRESTLTSSKPIQQTATSAKQETKLSSSLQSPTSEARGTSGAWQPSPTTMSRSIAQKPSSPTTSASGINNHKTPPASAPPCDNGQGPSETEHAVGNLSSTTSGSQYVPTMLSSNKPLASNSSVTQNQQKTSTLLEAKLTGNANRPTDNKENTSGGSNYARTSLTNGTPLKATPSTLIGTNQQNASTKSVLPPSTYQNEPNNAKDSTSTSGSQCAPTMLNRASTITSTSVDQQTASGTTTQYALKKALPQFSTDLKESFTDIKKQADDKEIAPSSGSQCAPTMLCATTPTADSVHQQAASGKKEQYVLNRPLPQSSADVHKSSADANRKTDAKKNTSNCGSQHDPTVVSHTAPGTASTSVDQKNASGTKKQNTLQKPLPQSSHDVMKSSADTIKPTCTKESTSSNGSQCAPTVPCATTPTPTTAFNQQNMPDTNCQNNLQSVFMQSSIKAEDLVGASTIENPTKKVSTASEATITEGTVNRTSADTPKIFEFTTNTSTGTDVPPKTSFLNKVGTGEENKSNTLVTKEPTGIAKGKVTKKNDLKGPTTTYPLKRANVKELTTKRAMTKEGMTRKGFTAKGLMTKQKAKVQTARESPAKRNVQRDLSVRAATVEGTHRNILSVNATKDPSEDAVKGPSKTEPSTDASAATCVTSQSTVLIAAATTSTKGTPGGSTFIDTERATEDANNVTVTEENFSESSQKAHENMSPKVCDISHIQQTSNCTKAGDINVKRDSKETPHIIHSKVPEEELQIDESSVKTSLTGEQKLSVEQDSTNKSSEESPDFDMKSNSTRSQSSKHSHRHRSSSTYRSQRKSKISHSGHCQSSHSECSTNDHCRSERSQLNRSDSSYCHFEHSVRCKYHCVRGNRNGRHRGSSGCACYDESQEGSSTDSCACSRCKEARPISRKCRSERGSIQDESSIRDSCVCSQCNKNRPRLRKCRSKRTSIKDENSIGNSCACRECNQNQRKSSKCRSKRGSMQDESSTRGSCTCCQCNQDQPISRSRKSGSVQHESSNRDSCACSQCNQYRVRSRKCRSKSGSINSGQRHQGWNDGDSTRSTTCVSQSMQGNVIHSSKHAHPTSRKISCTNDSDAESQQTISNASQLSSFHSSDNNETGEKQVIEQHEPDVAVNTGRDDSDTNIPSALTYESCKATYIHTLPSNDAVAEKSGNCISKNIKCCVNGNVKRSKEWKASKQQPSTPKTKEQLSSCDALLAKQNVPKDHESMKTHSGNEKSANGSKQKMHEHLRQQTSGKNILKRREIPSQQQLIPKENSIESWLRQSNQSMSQINKYFSSTEPSPVSSQELINSSSDALSLMNVSDKQTNPADGQVNHDIQDVTDTKGAFLSDRSVKLSKEESMAQQFVKFGLIKTTADFEEYKDNLAKDELARKQEQLLERACDGQRDMSIPQFIICPCAAYYKPENLPPHRCTKCNLICNEATLHDTSTGGQTAKAAPTFTSTYTVPTEKLADTVKKPIFRSKIFGLTGIPSEDKKIWQKFCHDIMSDIGEDTKIGPLKYQTSAFQSSLDVKKPYMTGIGDVDYLNHGKVYSSKDETKDTMFSVTETVSCNMCSSHKDEIQQSKQKIQELNFQLEDLKIEMKAQQRESELMKILAKNQRAKCELRQKLNEAEYCKNMQMKYGLIAERREELDIISCRDSDIEKQRNDERKATSNELERKHLGKMLRKPTFQFHADQNEKEYFQSEMNEWIKECQSAQTEGRANDNTAIKKWKEKDEEQLCKIPNYKSHAEKLQEMLQQHDAKLAGANKDQYIARDTIEEAYVKPTYPKEKLTGLQKDNGTDSSTIGALKACIETLRREKTVLCDELHWTKEIHEKEIACLKEDKVNLTDTKFRLESEISNMQDKLQMKSNAVTHLEVDKTHLDNRVLQLEEECRANKIYITNKNRQLKSGKITADKLREKAERLEDHLRFQQNMNKSLRDEKVLLGKKVSLLERELTSSWNEHKSSNYLEPLLSTSESEDSEVFQDINSDL